MQRLCWTHVLQLKRRPTKCFGFVKLPSWTKAIITFYFSRCVFLSSHLLRNRILFRLTFSARIRIRILDRRSKNERCDSEKQAPREIFLCCWQMTFQQCRASPVTTFFRCLSLLIFVRIKLNLLRSTSVAEGISATPPFHERFSCQICLTVSPRSVGIACKLDFCALIAAFSEIGDSHKHTQRVNRNRNRIKMPTRTSDREKIDKKRVKKSTTKW